MLRRRSGEPRHIRDQARYSQESAIFQEKVKIAQPRQGDLALQAHSQHMLGIHSLASAQLQDATEKDSTHMDATGHVVAREVTQPDAFNMKTGAIKNGKNSR